MNIDTSGNGKAAAFDSKNSISSDGKGFCNTVDNIAAGINELNPNGSCN